MENLEIWHLHKLILENLEIGIYPSSPWKIMIWNLPKLILENLEILNLLRLILENLESWNSPKVIRGERSRKPPIDFQIDS